MEREADKKTPWHAREASAVLAELESTRDGLSAQEAAARRQRYGAKRPEVTPPASAWSILVAQFRSVVVLLLVVAAGLALALGDPADAMAIAAVLFINAALGFITEFRARRAMDALRGLEVPRAIVVREGTTLEISARDLVPGDVISLESGQDRKSTRLNSSHLVISYAVFCLKKK